MPFPAIPVAIGAGVLALGGVALRLRALSKVKIVPVAPVPPTPAPAGKATPPTPLAVEQSLPPIAVNPDGSKHDVGTPFVFSSNSDAAAAVAEANKLGISVHELLARQSGDIGSAALPTAPVGRQAIVTTKDPAPAGDLIVRDKPNGSQIGGADKGGTVLILRDVDDTWAQIAWGGGRWPEVQGFSRKAFLKVV